MSSNTSKNELIAVIDAWRGGDSPVKSIRKQKYDPANFYITLTDGKQVGPVKCDGSPDELNRKFGEAISYMNAMKAGPRLAVGA
jgi:hypothetical protein